MAEAKPILFRAREGEETLRVTHENGAVALLTEEPQALPPFLHAAALRAGALCDDLPAATRTIAPAPKADPNSFTPEKILREALLAMVKRGDPDDFTDAGPPKLKAISKASGFNVDKDLLGKVWRELEAEAAAAEAAEKADAAAAANAQ